MNVKIFVYPQPKDPSCGVKHNHRPKILNANSISKIEKRTAAQICHRTVLTPSLNFFNRPFTRQILPVSIHR